MRRVLEVVGRLASWVLATALALALTWLTVEFATGRVDRAYGVLDPAASVPVGGESATVAELAERYEPAVFLNPAWPTAPLLAVRYEAVEADDAVVLTYFFEWEDEVHPNPVTNAAYWLYRAARYGTPVRDIEYVQVNVASDGMVDKVRFETTPGSDYFVEHSVHLVDEFTARGDTFVRETTTRTGESASAAPAELTFEGDRVAIGVATWNHLWRALPAEHPSFSTQMDAELTPLTAAEYRDGKYARKSQGDYVTREPESSATVRVIALAAVGAGALALVPWAMRGRRSRPDTA